MFELGSFSFYTIPQIQDSSGILRSVVSTDVDLAEFDLGDLGLLEALTLAGCFPARAPMTRVDRR